MIECNNNIEHEIWNALVWRHFYKICYHGAYKELSMSPWVIYKAMIYIYIYIYIYIKVKLIKWPMALVVNCLVD